MKAAGRRVLLLAAAFAAFALGGAGTASAASIEPASWDFGNQGVGSSGATKTFTVTRAQICVPFVGCFPNPGDSLTPVGVTGPFVAAPAFGCILATSSCSVDVTFLPVATGLGSGTLTAGSGSANLRGTGVPGAGGAGTLQQAQTSSSFSFGKLKLNKKTGIAILTVEVPGAGNLALGGNGVAKQRIGTGSGATISKVVGAPGKVQLKVKAKGAKKSKLNDTGKVKVKPKVTFTPTGGIPATESKKITLKKNL